MLIAINRGTATALNTLAPTTAATVQNQIIQQNSNTAEPAGALKYFDKLLLVQ